MHLSKAISLPMTTIMLASLMISGCSVLIAQPLDETVSTPLPHRSQAEMRQLMVNGKAIATIDNTATELDDYVPIAPISEALGWIYTWDKSTGVVTVEQQNGVVTTFSISSLKATRNGYPVSLQVAPKIIQNEVWLSGSDGRHGGDISMLFTPDSAAWDDSGQSYQVYQFPELDQMQTNLEKEAISAIERQLRGQQIEFKAVGGARKAIEESGKIESSDALNQFPKDIEIQSVQQLTDSETVDDGLVKVVVNFSVAYQPAFNEDWGYWLFKQPGKTQYEHSYLIRFRDGQTDLELISERIDRSSLGSPVPFLDESDFARISNEWQQSNAYSLSEILKMMDDLVEESERSELSCLLLRVNTQNPLILSGLDDETILSYFSESVRTSLGWDNFLKLENSKDPDFTVLHATSTEDLISAIIIGNWTVDSINMRPVLLDVDLSWDGEIWRFTRMENVRQYESVYDLAIQEPQLYERISEQFVFRKETGINPFYL